MSFSNDDLLSGEFHNPGGDPRQTANPEVSATPSELDAIVSTAHNPKLTERGEGTEGARQLGKFKGSFGPLEPTGSREKGLAGSLREDNMHDDKQTLQSSGRTGLEGLVRLSRASRTSGPTAKKTQAVLLLRVSSQRQLNTGADVDSDGNSIATQREWARRKVSSLGATIIKEFVEPGHSAQAIAKRPIFRQMLEFVRDNAENIGYVIIYSRSRAFRNIYDANNVEQEFEQLGIDLVSATEDFGGDRDQAALMKQITDGINHYQVRANGRDVAKKMLHKVEQGGSVGRAKIGYVNDRKEFEGRLVTTISADPQRAPLIRWAFETYGAGEVSLVDLVEMLTAQGLTTRPTRRWPQKPLSRSQLANILRDPFYCGVIRYKGELYPGRHESLITKELFLRVQTILDSRAQRGQRDVVHNHWAKGLVWCDRCWEAGRRNRLIYTEARGRHGGLYEYYICTGRQRGLCDLPSLPVGNVEEAIGRLFGRLALTQTDIDTLRQPVDEAVVESQELERELRVGLRGELRRLDIKEGRLIDLAADGDVPTVKLRERLTALRIQRGDIEERLAVTDDQISRGVRMIHILLDFLRTPGSLFDSAADPIRRFLIEAFFSEVRLNVRQENGTLHELPEIAIEAANVARRARAGSRTHGQAGDAPEREEAAHRAASSADVGPLARFLLMRGLSKPTLAGVPGLEPRTTVPETAVLPITPYPNDRDRSRAD
jgi:site-specific DNA recombinase